MLLGKWTADMMDNAGFPIPLPCIYPKGHAGSCDQWSEHHINYCDKTSAQLYTSTELKQEMRQLITLEETREL